MHVAEASLYVLCIALLCAAAAAAATPEITTLRYGGGKEFETTLYDAHLLGELKAPGKEPYLIMSGRGCVECDANISVYIHSPSDGPMKGEGLERRSFFPGNYYAYDTGKLSYRVRMFIGQCIESAPNEVIWVVDAVGDDGRWHQSGFLASIVNGQLSMKSTTELPRMSVLRSKAKRACREVPPIPKAYTEP